MRCPMQKIKEWFIAGMIIAIPFLVVYFIIKMVVGLTSFWREPFVRLSIEEYYLGIMNPFLTFLLMVCIGFFVTSDFIHSVMGRVLRVTRIIPSIGPLAEKTWLAMRGLAKRIIFIFRSGYKVVLYEEHGKDHGRWRPAIVVGKTIREYRGKQKLMLWIITPQLQIPDPRMIAPEETRIVPKGTGRIALILISGGFVTPDIIKLEDWTREKFDEIPEFRETEPPVVEPKDTKQNNNDGDGK